MYGVIPFYKACKKHGIHPIIGLTASIFSEEEEKSYPLVLLAENEIGYQNLLKISSSIMTKSKRRYSEEMACALCERTNCNFTRERWRN